MFVLARACRREGGLGRVLPRYRLKNMIRSANCLIHTERGPKFFKW